MVDTEIDGLIRRYVRKLAEAGVRVERAVLFGSRAAGTARPDSDVDVAIVSPDFGRNRFDEGAMLQRAAWRVDTRLEPIPLSSASYRDDEWLPLVHEIRNRGVVVYQAA